MTTLVYAVLYLSAAVFAIATVARAVLYARQPIHLRWELYPVPHEAVHRVKHGGSYFEETDWWTKPSHFNLWGELSFMVPEMLFLKALHEFNRKLWYRSFPFHFGLYLLMGTVGLVLFSALLGVFLPSSLGGPLGSLLHWACLLMGGAGVTLSMVGALLLLHRRLTDPALKTYTTAGDIFNLVFFVVAFGVLSAGYFLMDPAGPGVVGITMGLLRADLSLDIPGLFGVGLILCGLLAAYIPLTHMSHFVGKYFTYHSVRWQDHPNRPASDIEKKLQEYLTYRPTWSAEHVTADGKRTWADVATTNPWQGEKK